MIIGFKLKFTEHDGGVVAAESESVAHGRTHVALLRLVERKVELLVDCRIDLLDIDCRGNNPFLDCEYARQSLDSGSSTQQIILPVSKSIIAVIVLFYGIQHWNAWFNASIYLQNRDLYPLQLTLREIVLKSSENSIIANADGETVDIYRPLIKYCTIMVSIIPMMIVYPFVQKYFVKGVMIGSIKG